MWLVNFILHIGDHLQELVNNYGKLDLCDFVCYCVLRDGLVVLPFLPGDSMFCLPQAPLPQWAI